MGTLLALAGVALISLDPVTGGGTAAVHSGCGGRRGMHRAGAGTRARVTPCAPGVHERRRHDDRCRNAARRLYARGEPLVLPQRVETWVAIGFLAVIGSVVVFVLYLVVLSYWAASRAAYGFVLIPLVTVVLSAWLDDEPVTAGLMLGGFLILAGVYIGALRPARAKQASAAQEPGTGPSVSH
jgi:hypothetical protein